MLRVRLAPAAEQDIESILRWTHETFGEQTRLLYEELLIQAILDLQTDPARAGSQRRPELVNEARSYHLRSSRDNVHQSIGRIHKPRHFLIFRVGRDSFLEIARILHDSMDLAKHLPQDYRAHTDDI
ncbi:Plasmid stabilization system protein [Polystyrenella longa]|uniref:Plasmid stabilization system protein n=1 Tax=Polystyrenella longa TaxID=2528007 RepID=A0A518CLQ5_9PLAN|nr:type II toxin-antitoxin system RelE/ParE family toxin [Polystyrenella longa]QDU80152.1 Plasmid stabilization system protein [Polystyrenella longa]